MTQTNSPTLLYNPTPLHMSLMERQEVLYSGTDRDISYQQVDYTVFQVTNLTNDGGTRLLLTPSQQHLTTRRSLRRSAAFAYLAFFYLVAEVIAKATIYSLRQAFTPHNRSQNLPHLEAIEWMKTNTCLKQERIGDLLGVSRQTIHRWENGEPIKDANCQRIYAVRDVLERAARWHSTPKQLTAWLDTPRGADGRTPAQLLEANEINRARLLAVSSPSPRLVRPPAWVKGPIPESFRKGAERRQEALPPEPDSELSKLIENGEYGIDEDGEVFPLS